MAVLGKNSQAEKTTNHVSAASAEKWLFLPPYIVTNFGLFGQ